jgi:hypothetical protein
LKHGEFYNGEEANYAEAIEIINYADAELPKFRA